MKRLSEKIVAGGFGVALLLLCSVGVTSYLSIQQLNKDKQWVTHTYQVLATIDGIDEALSSAESARCHLIFTSESFYLQTYQLKKTKIYQELQALRYLTKDNPKQQRRLDLIEPLIYEQIGLFEESIKQFENQKIKRENELIFTERGKQISIKFDAIADVMKDEEQTLLQQRTAKTDKSTYQIKLVLILGSCLSLVLFAIVYNLLQKEIRINQALSQEAIRLEQEAAKTKLGSFLESTTDAFVALDRDWRYTYVNQRAGQLFNRRPEDLVGKNIWQEFPEAIGQKFYHAYHRALAEQRMIQLEEYYPPWERWYENRIYPSQEGLSIFFQDITLRKLAEIALQRSEKRYRTLVIATSQAVWLNDSQGLPKEFSSWLALTGQTEDEVKGGGWLNAIHPEDREQAVQAWNYAFETKSQCFTQYQIKVENGTYRHFAVRIVPVFDNDEEILEWVGAHTDITERVLAEQALKEANERLEFKVQERTQELQLLNTELQRSNQELAQFAYVASHDLQEPLRAIMGYTQILEEEYENRFDQSAQEYMHYITDGAKRMQQLIRDLLAYSHVGTRGKAFTTTDCNVVLNQALSNLQVAITESKATIIHDPLPRVIGDKTQLVQLFQNLIGNAIKFHSSQPPQIHIGAVRGKAAKENYLSPYTPQAAQDPASWENIPNTHSFQECLFWVRDNGIGIKSEYCDRIFEIFRRLHTRREFPGTGIGLAICKKIVERHDGRIWAESQPGVGTVFYFTLRCDFNVD
jgi:PAS domain S-box-containing protein